MKARGGPPDELGSLSGFGLSTNPQEAIDDPEDDGGVGGRGARTMASATYSSSVPTHNKLDEVRVAGGYSVGCDDGDGDGLADVSYEKEGNSSSRSTLDALAANDRALSAHCHDTQRAHDAPTNNTNNGGGGDDSRDKTGDGDGDGDGALVYESPTTQIYRTADADNVLGPPGVSVAIKLLTDPSDDDVVALNNEYNVLMGKLSQCGGARRALKQGRQDGFQAIYLEWVDGVTLRRWAESNRYANLLDRIRMARAVCASLSDVHGCGVSHNDITCDNIVVDADFRRSSSRSRRPSGASATDLLGGCRATFIDFGYADALSSHESTDAGETANDDLFALGSVLYELFTNRRSSSPDQRRQADGGVAALAASYSSLPTTVPGVPQSVSRLLTSLMANGDGSIQAHPYAAARDVTEDLDRMLTDPATYLFDPPEEDDLLSLLDDTVASDAPTTATIDRGGGASSPDGMDDAVADGSRRLPVPPHSSQSSETVLVAAYSGKSSLMNLAMDMIRRSSSSSSSRDVNGATDMQQAILERLAVHESFDFVWLTSSTVLADSLRGLADRMDPDSWLLSIFFGDPNGGGGEGQTVLSRLRTYMWGGESSSMNEGNELVALFLDPYSSEFDATTFRSRSYGSVGAFVIKRRAAY